MANDYSIDELQACVLSRHIQNAHIGGMPGVRSEVPLAAICLAARHHAPDLVLYTIHGEADLTRLSLSGTSSDWEASLGSAHPTSLATFFDLLQTDVFDWIFYGAMQIDAAANINLVCAGDHARPKFRGPGTAGGSSTNFAKQTFVWLSEHSRRVFVPRVDFISVPGYGATDRSAFKMSGIGPSPIVTPLGVLAVDPSLGRIRLVSRHPGVETTEILDCTGFELLLPDTDVPITEPPRADELAILRESVDPKGLLRRNHGA